MLQAIRDKAGSFIVKLLFLLLILSFGVWGIGDIFFQKNTDLTVATVGDRKVQPQEVENAVRQELERFRGLFGSSMDMEQAKALGVVDGVVQQIVGRNLLDLEARRLGLVVSDEAVRDAILNNPAFKNESGAFDRARYNIILANNRLSEGQYEASLRQELGRTNLAMAATGGVAVPPVLSETLYRMRNEKRVADVVSIGLDKAGEIAPPDDAELTAFYDVHVDAFRTPELRSFTALVLRPEDVMDEISVSEDKPRQEYNARQSEFRTDERRQLEQIVVADEAKAKEAGEQIKSGADFAEVAKSVAGAEPDATKLGWMKRDELPPEIGDVAFGLEQDQVGEPVKSPFGWHILRVTGIEPGKVESFDEVKDRLATEMKREQAVDMVYKVSNEVDDALAGGATLEQAAERFKLKLTVGDGVEPNGKTRNAAPLDSPVAADLVKTAFNTPKGDTSRMTEAPQQEGVFYIVRTDDVTPSAVPPLADVRDRAVEMWTQDKKRAAVEAQAKDLAAAVGPEKTLAQVAAEQGLTVTSPSLLRTGAPDGSVPGALVSQLFEAKTIGAVVRTQTATGFVVAQLKSIERPDPAVDPAGVSQVASQVENAVRGDLLGAYDRALRKTFPVTINEDQLQRLF
jgi:peptidyl-prolyl cis-trans isomerase D